MRDPIKSDAPSTLPESIHTVPELAKAPESVATGSSQVATPLASEVKILPSACDPLIICSVPPEIVSFCPGEVVPSPRFQEVLSTILWISLVRKRKS